MNLEIEWDRAALRGVSKTMDAALEQTAEWIIKDVRRAKTIPRQHGILQGEAVQVARSVLGSLGIMQSTPYARRLYYHPEYNFQRGPRTKTETVSYKGTVTVHRKDGTTYERRKRVKEGTEGATTEERLRKPKNARERGGFNPNAGALWWEPYLTGEKRAEVQRQFLKACRRLGLGVSYGT
jgi:hypothetical protein